MSSQVTAAIIAAIVSGITLIVTSVAQWLSRRGTRRDLKEQREHLTERGTLTEQRIRTLNERFATAAGQLGSDKPPEVRLAGVYAMAGLADDWEENRQTCFDVLCGYLRMPYEPDPGDEAPAKKRLAFEASREVRHTVIRVITAHLKAGAAVSWQGLNLDFTGAVCDGGDFRDAVFSGGGVGFNMAKFTGGKVRFATAKFTGAEVSFEGARFSGGVVGFTVAKFTGSNVSFGAAKFTGGEVDFTTAEFSGGTVSFDAALNWSVPPAFPWTDTPPPGVKLPKKEDQSQA